jgi:hypothetical protein
MRQSHTQMHFLPADRFDIRAFSTGISLHSHTEHSREELQNMPRYLEHMPVVAQFYQREMRRYRDRTGAFPDFSKAFWRGPLSARAALKLEQDQIEKLGLAAIVSLSDHDNIDAGRLLNGDKPSWPVPISVEWTVPYEESYFHLGIHNLPAARAVTLMEEMEEYTRKPHPWSLDDLLDVLSADPFVLIVFNHPLWDMAGVGSKRALALIKEFLRTYAQQIHALEINGLRSWPENMAVARMGRELGYAVVSGGDRHGFEANAVINLTRAATMVEFVDEIRNGRSSDIAVLPQYGEPLLLRHLRTAWDAVRQHPHLKNRQFWVNRVYVRCEDGVERPLSSIWTKGAPAWINPCLNVVGMLASQVLRTPFRLAFAAAGARATGGAEHKQ